MLTTFVFFFALLTSVCAVPLINEIWEKVDWKTWLKEILSWICLLVPVLLWSWLYYLSH